ncbi:MAG: extracellular solute-binding protein, partial [Desulfonatronovibrio sp.]
MSISYQSRVITGITVLAVIFLLPFAVFAGGQSEASRDAGAELTFGSWRTDDVRQINALINEFNKEHPDIRIKFDPTNPPDYNATLRLQLEQGTGPDIFYARSYA